MSGIKTLINMMYEFVLTIQKVFKSFGVELGFLFAGITGAYVSNAKNKKLNPWEKLTAVVSGGVVATYLTPVLCEWVQLGENTKYGVSFLLGYMGLKGVEMIIEKVKSKLLQ